jgi:hypothetical protein
MVCGADVPEEDVPVVQTDACGEFQPGTGSIEFRQGVIDLDRCETGAAEGRRILLRSKTAA